LATQEVGGRNVQRDIASQESEKDISLHGLRRTLGKNRWRHKKEIRPVIG
jgi:hypothetical protein